MSDKRIISIIQEKLGGIYEETDLESALDSDLDTLFSEQSGVALVESVIARVQKFAAAYFEQSADDLENLEGGHWDDIQAVIIGRLLQRLLDFITDEHRIFIVRCHARSLSTTEAVRELIRTFPVLHRLGDGDAIGETFLVERLVHRLSYLKPGTSRWPEHKYGDVWRMERVLYQQELVNTPLSTPVEQVALLANIGLQLRDKIASGDYESKELPALINAITRIEASLTKNTTRVLASPDMSDAQLITVLEKYTLSLASPNPLVFGDNTAKLVPVLEKMLRVLKNNPQQPALVANTDTEVLPTSAAVADEEA